MSPILLPLQQLNVRVVNHDLCKLPHTVLVCRLGCHAKVSAPSASIRIVQYSSPWPTSVDRSRPPRSKPRVIPPHSIFDRGSRKKFANFKFKRDA
eukprot:scaffold28418_cov124-Skeletonema_dohrnii-CCMP3373.AAC.2